MRSLNLVSTVFLSILIFALTILQFTNHFIDDKTFQEEKLSTYNLSPESVFPERENSIRRENITFILGKDAGTKNPYYSQAEKYFRADQKERTEYLITYCSSLVEVRNYLTENPPANGLPWGQINLVSHGNQWQGLSVAVSSGSERTTSESIEKAINNGVLIEIDDTLLDEESELFVRGCGVGNDLELLKKLAEAFGGMDVKPTVRASKLFEYYYSEHAETPGRMYAKSWLAYYKTGYRPGDIRLARQLQNNYPNENKNRWDALSRTVPRWAGDSYHYTFNIPVKWIVVYPHRDSVPDISTRKSQEAWIKNQPDLNKVISTIGISPDKFDWRFRNIRLRTKDGAFLPAIRAKGYCTVLCVLEPLKIEPQTGTTNFLPYDPKENDTIYFGIY